MFSSPTHACFTVPLCSAALPLPSGVQAAWGCGDWGEGCSQGVGDTYWSTTSGICTCSMGMSCSRSSRLCTYWILLMNLTLAEGEGREVAQGPEGTKEDRDTHTSSPRMLEQLGSELPPCPVPASTPCPQRGGQSRARGLPSQEDKSPEPRVCPWSPLRPLLKGNRDARDSARLRRSCRLP